MSFGHGRLGVMQIDNSSGTLTDISSYCTNVDFPQTVDQAESTTYGASAKSFIPGLRDGKFTITAYQDATLDTLVNGVLGAQGGSLASVSYEYGPMGSATGKPKFTGEAFISSYKATTPVNGLAAVSIELQCSGAVTHGNY